MARIRTIKPEFPQSESMGRVSRDARGNFIKKAIPVKIRKLLAIRNGCVPGGVVAARCFYCSAEGQISWVQQPTDRGDGWVVFSGLEMDHVHPEFFGGESTDANIVLACRSCNRSKSTKHVGVWRAK